MNNTSHGLYDLYHQVWEQRDKRMDSYFLLGSPLPTLFLCLLYIILSVFIGPMYMKNRKPFKIRKTIITYNFIMVILNIYGHYQAWNIGWFGKYKMICEPVDTSNNPSALWVAQLCYLYYLSKICDWFDTIFFVLRKKFMHISVLHLYHHCIMPINVWIIARFMPGGHITFGGLLNTFVHIIMYTYYGFSALGPHWQKYLWWKKYITVIQMLQFIIGIIHGSLVVYYNCEFPRAILYYIFPQAFIFLILFGNFYVQAYTKSHLVESTSSKESKTHTE